jgi:hypothetical protein
MVRFGMLEPLAQEPLAVDSLRISAAPAPASAPLAMPLETPPGVTVDPAFVAQMTAAVPQVVRPGSVYETLLRKHPLTLRLCDSRDQFFVGLI